MPKVVTSTTLATLSVLGACYLTAYGGESACCESGGSQNPKYSRRPDVYLPLTWFSTAICEKEPLLRAISIDSRLSALTGVVASFILHLYDSAASARPWTNYGGTHHLAQAIIRDSLELVKMRRPSNGNDHEENQAVALANFPPPPYEPHPTLLSSYVLPSIPLRKRDMNKLDLTVITDISMVSPFGFRPLETIPKKRWRGRGRDVWERKSLGASNIPENV